MSRIDMVNILFNSGWNCSQIVSSYFANKYGVSQEQIAKIACGFGGGMRQGEVCGAVTGAIMVISMKYGNTAAEDSESKYSCYDKVVEFEQEFRKRNGTLICKELLEYDISTKEGMQTASEKNLFSTICPEMVECAIDILEELGY